MCVEFGFFLEFLGTEYYEQQYRATFKTINFEEACIKNYEGKHHGKRQLQQIGYLTDICISRVVDQIFSLMTYIDLSAAYDIVWRESLIYKLIKIIQCLTTIILINNMLHNRSFQVVMGTQSVISENNNGLPQGSVLTPLLFNLNIADMPGTQSVKFSTMGKYFR